MTPAQAADSLSTKNRKIKAVLVMLRAETNRIEALTKGNRRSLLEEVQRDLQGTVRATQADFSDNFTYCPVYYFWDTEMDRIRDGDFAGVLFRADSSIATDLPISKGSNNYLVVFYGFPTSQSKWRGKVTDTTKLSYDSGEPNGRGLVIQNWKLEQISYLYKFGYNNFFIRRRHKKYIYTSKHFDIEYFPMAKKFNERLFEQKWRPVHSDF